MKNFRKLIEQPGGWLPNVKSLEKQNLEVNFTDKKRRIFHHFSSLCNAFSVPIIKCDNSIPEVSTAALRRLGASAAAFLVLALGSA